MKDYQKVAIETDKKQVIVNAAAASGKTFIITERVKWLVKNNVARDRIVVITFTNNAAGEMKKRLGSDGDGIFIGTIHSYVNYLLLCSGVDTLNILEKERFNELFEMIIKHKSCIKPVEHLLLDEAQDSDERQWNFILKDVKPKNLYAVGDLNQSIYGFTGATPEIMESLMNDTNTTVYNLPINHRNDISILNYAKKIINKNNYDMPDESVANSTNMGKVIEAEYSDETLIKYIKNSIIEGREYKDWFVLGRSNAQVEEMFNTLSAHGIPCDTFKKADLTNEQLSDKMNTNTVKVLTIHSSKGLENDCVAVRGGVFWKPEERRVCYVAATRAKHMLLWFVQPKKKKKKKQDVFNWE